MADGGCLPFFGVVFCLGQFGDELAGILQRDSWRPRGNGIGSSNGRFQPLGASREQISALLRERQVSAGRMHGDPAVRDSGFNPQLRIPHSCRPHLEIAG